MQLVEALELLQRPTSPGAEPLSVALATGFEPLHLRTFLAGELTRVLPHAHAQIDTGVFDDLTGNIRRAADSDADSIAVVIEWADVDPRLALRRLGGWRIRDLADIAERAEHSLRVLEAELIAAAARRRVVCCPPTLPLPPLFAEAPVHSGGLELSLRASLAAFAARIAQHPRVTVASSQHIDSSSPAWARRGVMVAAASRNDPAMIELAFARPDLLLPADCVFPLQAGWGPKSQAIERILETWNVSSASVVFVDDSPLDLDEARAALPGLETMLFPADDDDLPAFLTRLRELFGKQVASSEDELRLASVRAGSSYRRDAARAGAAADEFLAQVSGCVEFSCAEARLLRALELINKTSQFNLNGVRLTERELQRALDERGMQQLSASYADRYGPLGMIAALLLERRESDLVIRAWVMSCRALSRRIEHHCLRFVFDAFAIDRVTIDYQPTDRNAPFREFLVSLLDAAPQPAECLTRQALSERGPALVHRVLAQDR